MATSLLVTENVITDNDDAIEAVLDSNFLIPHDEQVALDMAYVSDDDIDSLQECLDKLEDESDDKSEDKSEDESEVITADTLEEESETKRSHQSDEKDAVQSVEKKEQLKSRSIPYLSNFLDHQLFTNKSNLKEDDSSGGFLSSFRRFLDSKSDDRQQHEQGINIESDETEKKSKDGLMTSLRRVLDPKLVLANKEGAEENQKPDEKQPHFRQVFNVKALSSQLKEAKRWKMKYLIFAGAVLLFLLVVIIVPLSTRRSSKNRQFDALNKDVTGTMGDEQIMDGSSPAGIDQVVESSRLKILREMLTQVSREEYLSDSKSAQYSALRWMADRDPQALDYERIPFRYISERYIAALLYFATNGDDWRNQYNFLTMSSVCDWNDAEETFAAFEGIRCDDNGHIMEILLNLNFLRGTIPNEMGLLDLYSLGLGSNSLEGTLPTEFGELSNLQWLTLSGNQLHGTLPTELNTLYQLSGLFLNNNDFSGTIPSSFESLINLEALFIEGNTFTGSVDSAFCNDDREIPYRYFFADCDESFPEVTCSCCTHCCDKYGKHCIDVKE